jgi:hypothetical protein
MDSSTHTRATTRRQPGWPAGGPGQGRQPAWYEVVVNKKNNSSETSRQLIQKFVYAEPALKLVHSLARC